MPVFGASYELQRRLIEVFNGDGQLKTMLYPSWSPKNGDQDIRIYGPHPALNAPELLTTLPRVIVECEQEGNGYEQADIIYDSGLIDVYIHIVVPQERYQQAELIDERIRTIINSTNLSNNRIIASEMVQTGRRRRFVETAFYDSWRLVTPYEVRNVGVLA